MAKNTAQYKKNQIIELTVDGITDLGFGVGRIDGLVVFLADTVPGDVCRAKIIKVNSSYLVCRVEEYLHMSESRVDDRCTAKACKSCPYKCISYADEIRLKEDMVKHCFATPALSGVEVGNLVISPTIKRYRNKAQYPIASDGGRLVAGFYAPKSHRVTPVEDCMLAPAVFGEILSVALDMLGNMGVTAYDETSGEGLLRHVYLRRGELTGEMLLTFVINGNSLPNEERIVATLTERFPKLVGILVNENRENTNVILGKSFRTLYGRDYIYDFLAGVRLKITAPSFYQVNHGGASRLYDLVRKLAAPTKNDLLLDLYCGTGSIGLSLAKDAGEVIGIEIIESAVKCANENVEDNGIKNARFFTGDAAETEKLLKNAEGILGKSISPDIVILDPPRAGCAAELLRFVASLSPKRIVYVSCNPKTLARDAELLLSLGYSCGTVTPVDMFPGTGHVESVVCLTKSDKAT